tara:strand:+ start:347 stop:1039 length:693 start_codon:yes stop_codon:yes gene_type:complete
MKAVIMAGGIGKRLRPFTYSIPKPLLSAGGVTSIENTISILSQYNIKEIFILTCYKSEMFNFINKFQKKYKVKIKIVNEKKSLGTIGGISLLKKNLSNSKFIILNGDIFFSFNINSFINFHKKKKSYITIGMHRHNLQFPYAIIKSDIKRKIKTIKEKPIIKNYINAGIYILDKKIFNFLDENEYIDMPDLIEKVYKYKKNIFTFDIGEKWVDLGRIEDYRAASKIISKW